MTQASAHREGVGGEPHDLVRHLADVATLAARNAAGACPGDGEFTRLASSAGWLHDLGKYRVEFQEYLHDLRAGGPETQHAVFGAAGVLHKGIPFSVALAILGHHAGLHDFSVAQGLIKATDLNPLETSKALLARLDQEWPGGPAPWAEPMLEFIKRPRNVPYAEHEDELRIRMLFSCLVDADYLDTEAYMTGLCRVPLPFRAAALFGRLQGYVCSAPRNRGAETAWVMN